MLFIKAESLNNRPLHSSVMKAAMNTCFDLLYLCCLLHFISPALTHRFYTVIAKHCSDDHLCRQLMKTPDPNHINIIPLAGFTWHTACRLGILTTEPIRDYKL